MLLTHLGGSARLIATLNYGIEEGAAYVRLYLMPITFLAHLSRRHHRGQHEGFMHHRHCCIYCSFRSAYRRQSEQFRSSNLSVMSNRESSFANQIRRNAVALISLIVAVSSLSYNTWRNEKTESNRNQRVAAFEILLKLGELQQVVFLHHYDKDTVNRGNPRLGWTYVLTIRDLSRVFPPPLPERSDELVEIWGWNWEGMEANKMSVDAILAGIEATRTDVLGLLQSLE